MRLLWILQKLLEVRDGIIHSFGEMLALGGVEARHGDAAVRGEVDVPLLGEVLHLGLGEAGVGEHSDLVEDVLPVAGGIECGEACIQHLQDAALLL
jgi:hypothetical protein